MEGPRTLTRKQFELVFNHFVQNILPWLSPGPWDYDAATQKIVSEKGQPIAEIAIQQSAYERDANAELLALARNTVPILLDTLKYGFAGEVKVNAKKTNRTRKTSEIRD